MKRMEINKCMGCMSQFRRYPAAVRRESSRGRSTRCRQKPFWRANIWWAGCWGRAASASPTSAGISPGVIILFPIWSYRKNHAPISRWGRMHWEYLKAHKPIQYNCLLLSGKLWISLADLNGQTRDMGCGPHCAVLP